MRKRVSARPSFMPRSGGEQAKISGMRLTREEGIMLTRDGVDMSLRAYSDLLDELEG